MNAIKKLSLVVLLGVSASAFAATPAASSTSASSGVNLNTPAAKLVSKIMNGQGAITDTFPAVDGLTGFVVKSAKGNSGIIYGDKKASTFLQAPSSMHKVRI